MMTKYTPGPWHVVRHETQHIADTDGNGIARTHGCGAEQNYANARLIAAAPDLLEACELLMKWIGPPPADQHSYDSLREDAWNKARAAIAKVEAVE